MSLNATIARVTDRIVARSRPLRRAYLDRVARARDEGPKRAHLTCGNQAHAYAAMPAATRTRWSASAGNLGIVTAYNDMLSAHQPYETYPALIRRTARGRAARRRWRAACRRCATGSPRARPGWSSRSSRAT